MRAPRPLWHDTVAHEREAERLRQRLKAMQATLAALDEPITAIESEAFVLRDIRQNMKEITRG